MKLLKLCEHVKENGIRCGSPALRNKHYCYYHNRIHTREVIAPYAACRTIRSLDTPRHIRRAIAAVGRDLRAGAISLSEARVLMWALQLASSTIKGGYIPSDAFPPLL